MNHHGTNHSALNSNKLQLITVFGWTYENVKFNKSIIIRHVQSLLFHHALVIRDRRAVGQIMITLHWQYSSLRKQISFIQRRYKTINQT